MANIIDLTNKVVGKLTVLRRDYSYPHKQGERQAFWLCKCECGNLCVRRGYSLRNNLTYSCGCEQKNSKHPRKKPVFHHIPGPLHEDLKGKQFGKVLVVEYADEEHQKYYGKIKSHKPTWLCKCECGKLFYVTSDSLKRGYTLSCGCIKASHLKDTFKDLTGKKFGHLLVLSFVEFKNNNALYKVKCDCGKEYNIYSSNLISGATTSCGCIKESKGEQKIASILTQNNIKFIKQKTFKDLKTKNEKGKVGILKYDFYLPDYNTVIEYDGVQHFESVKRWGGYKTYLNIQIRDNIKNKYAHENNIIIIRIKYIHFNNIKIEDLLPDTSKFIV